MSTLISAYLQTPLLVEKLVGELYLMESENDLVVDHHF